MQIIKFLTSKLSICKQWFIKTNRLTKIIIVLLLVGIGWLGYQNLIKGKSQQPQYQTAQVERGTLIVSVTASGSVSTSNSTSVTTQASGVVKTTFVKNGQAVTMGAPIAEIELDRDTHQKYLQALSSYQSAKNAVSSSRSKQYSLQATMFDNWDTFRQLAINSTYTNSDGTPNYVNRALPEFHIAEKKWLAAEADYINQQSVIVQSQTAMSTAWSSYQQTSPIIYAPISGTITGLSLQKGSVVPSSSENSNASTTTTSSQKIANIETDASPMIIVNLTEIDIPRVAVGNKATITLDAFSDKTFTGKIISVDTVGSASSGVTSYPVIIQLDIQNKDIFPNMSASASIITQTKDSVLLISTSAIQNQNGQSTVRVMKNKQVQEVSVETGLSSDTQTEIISGLSEGDTIVTSVISSSSQNGQQRTSQTQSLFSPVGGTGSRGSGGFGGGGGR